MTPEEKKIQKLTETVDALESQVIVLGSRLNQFYKLSAYNTYIQFKDDEKVSKEIKAKLLKVIQGKALVKEWRIVDGQPIDPILMGE